MVIANERGIALVVTLLVVALLTITVIEFTYSVEVDQHMTRNALSALQASLLARSGINFGEALLLHDKNQPPGVFAFTEDWCLERGRQEGTDRPRCVIDDFSSELPSDMLLKVEIVDESGKFNLNTARPRNDSECTALASLDLTTKTNTGPTARLRALQNILESRGMTSDVMDAYVAYWQQACTVGRAAAKQVSANVLLPGQSSASAAPRPDPNQMANALIQTLNLRDFSSLDDAGLLPGFTPAALQRLRPVLTAFRPSDVMPYPGAVLSPTVAQTINANTAPAAVLNAVLSGVDGADDCVSQIITARVDQAFQSPGQVPCSGKAPGMLGVNSMLFRIHASAVVHPDPVTGRGGVSRTASMLVLRSGFRPNPPPGMGHWSLTQLDWQKEGGAALFQQKTDQDSDIDEPATGMAPDPRG